MMTNISMISENDNSTVLTEYEGLKRTESFYQSEDELEKELIRTLVDQGYEYLTINSEDELIANLPSPINRSPLRISGEVPERIPLTIIP